MTPLLKNTFTELVTQYEAGMEYAEKEWRKIVEAYSAEGRHYHHLQHLEDMLSALTEVRTRIRDWNSILFALYYHDIIYEPLRSNNEERSAEYAAESMGKFEVPTEITAQSKNLILATKSHIVRNDPDTNYFTDADLSILGADWITYAEYAKNIRKEYSIYPDLLYRPGRKKIIQKFLNMERIFKTDEFHQKLEARARINLQKELELLEN